MKEFKPICVGDTIKNTPSFGDVEVVDLFVSPRTQKIVYGIKVLDGSEVDCITTEDELYAPE